MLLNVLLKTNKCVKNQTGNCLVFSESVKNVGGPYLNLVTKVKVEAEIIVFWNRLWLSNIVVCYYGSINTMKYPIYMYSK